MEGLDLSTLPSQGTIARPLPLGGETEVSSFIRVSGVSKIPFPTMNVEFLSFPRKPRRELWTKAWSLEHTG